MKTFIFFTTEYKHSRRTGSAKFTLSVYEIVNNMPQHVCYIEGNTGSMRGYIHEVANKLRSLYLIPAEAMDGSTTGYFKHNNGSVQIKELY